MSFIGVICESKSENFVEQALSERLKDKTVMILKEDTIENLKNIKFETVIIMSNNKKIFENNLAINNIISKAKHIIVNEDEDINLNILNKAKTEVITYGFNTKSTITVSSVEEEKIMFCVQRTIEDLDGNKIELQEFNIKRDFKNTPTIVAMGIGTALLLYGIRDISI